VHLKRRGNLKGISTPAFQEAPYVVFKGYADFRQIRVSGEVNFGSAQFEGGADFYNARIDGPAFFRKDFCKAYRSTKNDSIGWPDDIFKGVTFSDPNDRQNWSARFRDAYFGGEMNFHAAQFKGLAAFSYLKCMGLAFFCSSSKSKTHTSELPCKFDKELDFEGAHFASSLRLDLATFPCSNVVNFRDCHIAENLVFRRSFPKKLLLTGCTYRRIECDNYEFVICGLNDFKNARTGQESTPNTFDRSSWIQFEATLRGNGEVEWADKAYRARMRQERRNALPWYRRAPSVLWDLGAAYGTSSWRLFLIALAIFLVGIPVFYRGQLQQVSPTSIEGPLFEPGSFKEEWWTSEQFQRALEVSLYQISPLKLPVGEEYKPRGGGKWFAVLEKIMGWLLIPLLVASLGGFLHRKAKAGGESEGGEE
jgi:Pentapeptide repeats (9 copies)